MQAARLRQWMLQPDVDISMLSNGNIFIVQKVVLLRREFEVLLYLCSVRQEQFTEEAVVEHDSDENSDVIAWVLDRYPALRTATRKE
ncbi:hypothetical protein PC123_g10473 [Phytophthora cactorum]|nr:hypothetical protein PC123_g10473 [Phytophthora cactorum]